MTEKEIHQQFNAFLRERGIPFIEARMDRASTIAKSWPDYTILWMGRVICIEVKTEKGRVSPAQNLKIDFIRQSGCRVLICRSTQECVEAAKGILCQGEQENDVRSNLERIGGIDWPHSRCPDGKRHRWNLDKICNRCGADQLHLRDLKELGHLNPKLATEAAPHSMTPAFTKTQDHPHFFIANVFGTDWVMAGESFAGGMASMVRRPTPQDIRDFPRK